VDITLLNVVQANPSGKYVNLQDHLLYISIFRVFKYACKVLSGGFLSA
jgi:hypothetical protein